jgi:hypothetical protein
VDSVTWFPTIFELVTLTTTKYQFRVLVSCLIHFSGQPVEPLCYRKCNVVQVIFFLHPWLFRTNYFAKMSYKFCFCRENIGLIALTRVGSRRVVQISAGFMIFFSVLGNLLVLYSFCLTTYIFLLKYCAGLIMLHFANQENLVLCSHRFLCPYLLACTVFSLHMLVCLRLLESTTTIQVSVS